MQPMTIRSYQADDQSDVIALWQACGLVVSHNDPRQDIYRKLRVNPEWFLIAEVNDEVVATCMVGYEGHRGWINYLAVSPHYQRRGIATRVMKEAENRLRAVGCPKINLQVRESNTAVLLFYKHLGFVQDEVISLGKRLVNDQPPDESRP